MPAHITVLYPFKPLEQIGDDDVSRLTALFAKYAPFDISFASTSRFPTTVWLVPKPDGPIRALTGALVRAFPAFLPYGGEFTDPIPHLTVAQGSEAVLDEVETALRRRLSPPIHARATHCTLFALGGGRWRAQRTFALGTGI